jgi:hypothetical protein
MTTNWAVSMPEINEHQEESDMQSSEDRISKRSAFQIRVNIVNTGMILTTVHEGNWHM